MGEPEFYSWIVSEFILPMYLRKSEENNLPNQKAVLLSDGHRSHISIHIIVEALKHKINLIKLSSILVISQINYN